MMTPNVRATRRSAFTLVELLVVMAIIAVLVGLTTAAVQQVRHASKRTQVQQEISQLSTAVESFKTDMGVDYMPCHFAVKATYDPNEPSALYLKRLFPRVNLASTGWTGDPIELTGNQCMVFFLGGINLQGFSTGPQPFTQPAPGQGKGPYFEFRASRMSTNPIYPQYLDHYGIPYVYLTAISMMYDVDAQNPGPKFLNDARENVIPFREPTPTGMPPKFINPHSFQIISAGKNKAFGPGGEWTPGMGPYAQETPGGDDLSNFSQRPLSSPPNQ